MGLFLPRGNDLPLSGHWEGPATFPGFFGIFLVRKKGSFQKSPNFPEILENFAVINVSAQRAFVLSISDVAVKTTLTIHTPLTKGVEVHPLN